jgi:LAS superfamily LD-carboxypeptidase LdcB
MIETQTLLLAAEVHKLAREYQGAERDKALDGYDDAMRATKRVEWEQANPFAKYVEMAYRDLVKLVTQMRDFERDDQRDG